MVIKNESNNSRYSVLMSVYDKETPDNLRTAMDSIWNQTVEPDDFVLVCDGPLTPELDEVVDEMKERHSGILQVVRLKENGGLGNALNAGMKCCKNELIARMDSDDISRPDRCELQMEVFSKNPELSIVSGVVEEFSESTDRTEIRRVLPEKQEEIVKFAQKRNPFNHPCVMYRKSAVEAVDGYKSIFLLEDYYLWVKMIQNGSIGYNIQRPLLWMRAGSDLYKRRSGMEYVRSQKELFKYMKNYGFISTWQYMRSVTLRGISSLMPNKVRDFVYKKVLRKARKE